jgi:alditol oxidase
MTTKQWNWAGNYEYTAARLHEPKTVQEVRDLVKRSKNIRALGTRHSFNHIADSAGELVSLRHLDRVISLDRERLTVTVEGGIRYGQLCQYLHHAGFALHNLASLPHISVAGACATATHGSGNTNGNLAIAVSEMQLVTADGVVTVLSSELDGDRFMGMVVGLGGFGIVTELTLDILPSFDMQQNVYENLPFAELGSHFDEITSSGYSVSLFTDWIKEKVDQVWLKRRVIPGEKLETESEWFGASPAARNMHPIAHISAENCTEQMGVPGPWYERLPHFRMDHTPSSGEELQSEYFIPRRHAFQALLAIHAIRERVASLLQISEIRTIAADKFWMSPCYEQDSVAIHFTWKKDETAVRELLPIIEEELSPYDVRPHWGKLFTMSPSSLMSRYERLDDFRQLLLKYDPQGKFRNSFLNSYIFGMD